MRVYVLDGELRRMLPYMLAMMGAYAVGILSLSRNYEVPTYTMLGLVGGVSGHGAGLSARGEAALFRARCVRRLIWLSLIFLLFTDLVVRFLAT